jgi:hypothetical protein
LNSVNFEKGGGLFWGPRSVQWQMTHRSWNTST